jgi:hypothetical protein
MSADLLFSIFNLAVLPGWLLLLVLPRWKWTLGLVSAGLIPFLLGLCYLVLFLLIGFEGPEDGGFGSLYGVMQLFTAPYAVLIGWIHYLAFDLFIGSWELQDSQRKGIPHWMMVPCLVLTFLLGPVGLVCYLTLRTIRTRSFLIYS